MHGNRLATVVMAALFAAAMALFLGQRSAHAAGNALSKADQQCLGCHSVEGLDKKLANGETLSLHVPGPAFAKSVHNAIGCASCHADITLENHPPIKAKIASIRENQLALTKVCQSCHADIFKQYEGSIHAALVREGYPGAPVCTDCHDPHAVWPNLPMTQLAERRAANATTPFLRRMQTACMPRPVWAAPVATMHTTWARDHGGSVEGRMPRVPPRCTGRPPNVAPECGTAFRDGILSRLPCAGGQAQGRPQAI